MNLHHAILRSFVERGYPPTTRELSDELGADASPGLRALADDHGVVLLPGSTEIWIAHPFSATPTAVWVTLGDRGWWAPCVWCALGVVALVGDEAKVRVRIGGEQDEVVFTVRGEQVTPSAFVHFPLPPREAWRNVVAWCSMVLPFRAASDAAAWSARHRLPSGAVVEIDRVLALARAWYGGHLAPDWRKHTVDEATKIFSAVGLVGPHWELPKTDGRF